MPISGIPSEHTLGFLAKDSPLSYDFADRRVPFDMASIGCCSWRGSSDRFKIAVDTRP